MIRFLIHVAVVALGLFVAWKVVPGIGFDSYRTLLIAALLLGLANAVVRPILVVLTLPLTIVTLGLWLIVINAAMIGLVSYFLKGFQVRDFIAMFLCWLVVTVVSWVASWFTGR
ncbi:MAG TPA: phage holin family protein [Caulobacteraceae bacterium]|nr:phage holin family protein [Caulobacteraceae bacterium]